MRRSYLALSSCLFRTLVPSRKANQLILEGNKALRMHDYDGALNAYNKIPEDERLNNKTVQGFYSRIHSTQRSKELADKEFAKITIQHKA